MGRLRGACRATGRGADREGDAEPPRSVVRRVPPPAHPPPVGAAVPRSRGSRRSRQLGASSGDAAAQRRRRRCCCRAWALRARWSASAVPALDPAGAVPSPLALSARAPLISPRPISPPPPPHPIFQNLRNGSAVTQWELEGTAGCQIDGQVLPPNLRHRGPLHLSRGAS